MAVDTKDLQVQETEKQEVTTLNGAERTRTGRVYVPRVDIYETEHDIVAVADIPGIDENSIEITVEKNILTIHGRVEPEVLENVNLAYAEYDIGDYERRFTLSNEIDQDKIEATVKNGVLHLRLPKAGPAKARKVSVKAV
ncbi:MAG TPA: Hsp20/alpha crystallin family protein [Anaerolineae bacterium]